MIDPGQKVVFKAVPTEAWDTVVFRGALLGFTQCLEDQAALGGREMPGQIVDHVLLSELFSEPFDSLEAVLESAAFDSLGFSTELLEEDLLA